MILFQQRLGDQQTAAAWEGLMDLGEKMPAFVEVPIVENSAEGVEIGGR